MASPFRPHPPWTSTLKPSKHCSKSSQLSTNQRKIPSRILIRLSSSSNSRNADDSSSLDSDQNQGESKSERVSRAFSRALDYKKSLRLNNVKETNEPQTENLPGNVDVGARGIGNRSSENEALAWNDGKVEQKSTEFEKSDGGMLVGRENNGDQGQASAGEADGKLEIPEAVRNTMDKAKEYKINEETASSSSKRENEKSTDKVVHVLPPSSLSLIEGRECFIYEASHSFESSKLVTGDENGKADVSEAFRISMDKAKEYKKNKMEGSNGRGSGRNENLPGPSDGAVKGESRKKELKLSKIDFMGLDFSDKKDRRGLPAGLVPVPDPFLGKELPEVELIVGDASRFGDAPSSESNTAQEEEPDLYKPKVSTWGVFPRPTNISKTFGGGKNIRPGQALETEEVRAAKQARTKQLIAEYKARMGLNVNPKLKAECEKVLRDGEELMDSGELKDALPYFQKVMEEMPFQTELHGLAALQWAICQDSLSRSDVAQVMYKKLKGHTNAQVSKKARQFAFSFEAMEMMKVRRSAPRNPGYQTYFDAFVPDKTDFAPQDSGVEEGALLETLPYIVFLLLPALMVLLIAAKHGT